MTRAWVFFAFWTTSCILLGWLLHREVVLRAQKPVIERFQRKRRQAVELERRRAYFQLLKGGSDDDDGHSNSKTPA